MSKPYKSELKKQLTAERHRFQILKAQFLKQGDALQEAKKIIIGMVKMGKK